MTHNLLYIPLNSIWEKGKNLNADNIDNKDIVKILNSSTDKDYLTKVDDFDVNTMMQI